MMTAIEQVLEVDINMTCRQQAVVPYHLITTTMRGPTEAPASGNIIKAGVMMGRC